MHTPFTSFDHQALMLIFHTYLRAPAVCGKPGMGYHPSESPPSAPAWDGMKDLGQALLAMQISSKSQRQTRLRTTKTGWCAASWAVLHLYQIVQSTEVIRWSCCSGPPSINVGANRQLGCLHSSSTLLDDRLLRSNGTAGLLLPQELQRLV